MTRFRQHLGNHRRTLLLLAAGAVMFLLWLGLWLRVLPDRPWMSMPVQEHAEVVGVSNGGRFVVTRMNRSAGLPGFMGFVSPYDRRGPIRVWDTITKSMIVEFLTAEDACDPVHVSPNGRYVSAETSGTKRFRLFDAWSGRELNIPCESHFVLNVSCFSPNGRLFARPRRGSRGSSELVVWDLLTEREKVQIGPAQGEWEHPRPMRFSRDSSRFASVQVDGAISTLVVTDIDTGKEIRRISLNDEVDEVFFDPTGSNLAVATKISNRAPPPHNLTVYDLESGEQVERHMAVGWYTFRPDGSLYVRSELEGLFRDCSSQCSRALRWGLFLEFEHWDADPNRGQIDRWKRSLLGQPSEQPRHFVEYVDLETGRLVCTLDSPESFHLSDDESVAACIGPTGHIEVWDLPPRRPIFTLLALAALPAFLFTAVIWWRLGRG